MAQEARHLVFVQSVGSDVVHECDTFRTLHKTVKIERVYGYFMLYGGQSEHFPQVVGDKRSVVHGFGQHPFIDGEHQDMPEIQVTRLQYAHDLQAYSRFAVEGNGGRAQHGAQQAAQGGGLYVERTVFRQADEAANDLMGTIERFVVQLAVHVAFPVFLLSEYCSQAFEQGADIDQ